jgi:uncharacterized membrane protein YbaN (DUF454 family)
MADVPNPASDLEAEMHLAKRPIVRWLYVAGGSLSLALGVLGILLPGLPTTPFLLLTAYCYARGSTRFYLWLMNNRFFGQYIRAWRNNEGIPLAVKVYVVLLLWYVLGFTAFLVVPLWQVRVLLLLVGLGVTIYIVKLPTRKP